jgi:hypothetical protein
MQLKAAWRGEDTGDHAIVGKDNSLAISASLVISHKSLIQKRLLSSHDERGTQESKYENCQLRANALVLRSCLASE